MISSLPFSVRGRHRRAVPVAVRVGVGLMVAAIWPAGLVQSDPPSGDDQAPPAGLIRFEDRQPISGIGFVLDNSTTPDKQIIDSMLGGLAVFDFDNDGLLDIFFTNGAKSPGLVKDDPRFWNRLYRNQGDGTFRDVTDHAGVQGEGYSMGVAAGDFDNDGLTDLYVTGVNRNILYRNRGDGRFADVTETAGVSGTIGDTKPWSVGSAWLDFDNDGDLDLFVVNYNDWTPENNRLCGVEGKRLSCSPTYYKKLPNLLYRNEGDGKFLDVSAAAGISGSLGYGMSLAVADADGDGFIDVFVANDQIRQFLFRNVRGRRFVEVGVETGAALTEDGVPFSGMGSEFRD
ncbi:MAG: VCBS repeat-containing protein, partial [Thermoanaerobaculales bacterium]|nr:VCBS repeat-containing protein [Thermoanaerobaculales bacterium]